MIGIRTTLNKASAATSGGEVAAADTRVTLAERRRIAAAADQARFDATGLPQRRLGLPVPLMPRDES